MNPNLLPVTNMKTPDTRARFAALFGGLLKISVGLTIVVAVIYLGLVVWLNHEISGQAISIVQAAGAPAEGERVFRGLLWLLMSFVAFSALIRLVLEAINPFVKPGTMLPKLAFLVAVSFAGSLLPTTLRKLRGVDANDLPVNMSPSDPVAARWWNADGKPVLFYSLENEDAVRFWNRPGITPDTGLQSLPVTREQRREWEQQRSDRAEEAERMEREAADKKAKQEAATAAELQKLTLRLQQEAVEKARRELEVRDQKHALELAELRRKQESETTRIATERNSLKQELEKTRDGERSAATQNDTETDQTSVKTSTPSGMSGKNNSTWFEKRIRPGVYLYVTGFPSRSMEVFLPHECEIEVQGKAPFIYSAGTAIISLPSKGNFRVRSRESREFEILVRQANNH